MKEEIKKVLLDSEQYFDDLESLCDSLEVLFFKQNRATVWLVCKVTYDYYEFVEPLKVFDRAKDAYNFAEKNSDHYSVYNYDIDDETHTKLFGSEKSHYHIRKMIIE